MLLAAIDDRIQLSFPCVMVSTAMQGGCTCENASLLRIGTGNVEFAGLFAPKPQGMNTANDWTKEMATKGFPELQKLYTTHGARRTRSCSCAASIFLTTTMPSPARAFYTFVNQHFKLGLPTPVIERDFEPHTREQLTVWDENTPHPKAGDPSLSATLLKWLAEDTQKMPCQR
jgi:hypothetical protein